MIDAVFLYDRVATQRDCQVTVESIHKEGICADL